jgi:hypothetical protein
MLNQIRMNQGWLGDISHVDTTAANSEDLLLIHQPEQSTTSKTWYAVTAGTQVGIFPSWYVQFTVCF